MNDRIISLWKWFWASKTILTPSLFSWNACTKVRKCAITYIGVTGIIFFLSLFTIFQLDFGIILTVCHFAVFFISLVHERWTYQYWTASIVMHIPRFLINIIHMLNHEQIYIFTTAPKKKHALNNHSWYSNYNIHSIVCY